jgi:predicted nucleic acid-binding protein
VYTIDASVHISALNPAEPDSSASQALLALIQRREIALFSPTLMLVEVAAAVAVSLGDPDRALALVGALRALPHQTLVPLDEELAEGAAQLAAAARLRGADAVYGVVAQRYGATLVTLDRRQLDRLPPVVRVVRPAEAVEAWA